MAAIQTELLDEDLCFVLRILAGLPGLYFPGCSMIRQEIPQHPELASSLVNTMSGLNWSSENPKEGPKIKTQDSL